MSPTLKRGLHWLGGGLAVLGIGFVTMRLREYGSELDAFAFGWAVWVAIASLAVTYGASNVLLALAWWHLLERFGGGVTKPWAIRAYGISQIAKYVPGNVFHLAGRQAMGVAAGVASWPLAKSAVWELGLIAFAGALFGLLVLPTSPVIPGGGIFPFVVVAGSSGLALKQWLGTPVARSFGLYLVFLAVSGTLFTGLLGLIQASEVPALPELPILIGAYVLAWLAGLLTPGAPAGVGVRELVLLLLLEGRVAAPELIQAVVLGRVVTVLGDLGFLLWAVRMSATKPGPNSVSGRA